MQFEEWTQKEIEEWWNFELKFLQNTFPEQFEELKVINKCIRTLIPIST
jgi:hypothetical protein